MRKAFTIVYSILALNFIIPVIIYIVAPSVAVESFAELGTTFGVAYAHSEDSMFWRVLGIANVATLGFCCVLLVVNLERFFAALFPLVFLKSSASLGFGVAYLFEPNPAYLIAFLFDGITVGAMVFFATRARRSAPALEPSP